MIRIKSTEKKAPSKMNGLCDISREMVKFSQDLSKGTTTVTIRDVWFQEQEKIKDIVEMQYDEFGQSIEVVVGQDVYQERLILNKTQFKDYTYPNSIIDGAFELVGSEINKGGNNYSIQHDSNKLAIFIAQTQMAANDGSGWYGMTNWVVDDLTDVKIVKKFT